MARLIKFFVVIIRAILRKEINRNKTAFKEIIFCYRLLMASISIHRSYFEGMMHVLTFQPTDDQALILKKSSVVCSKFLMYTANPQKVIGMYYDMMTLAV